MVAPDDLVRLVGRRVDVEYDGRMTSSHVIAVGTGGVTLNVGGNVLTVRLDDDVRIELPTWRPDPS